MADAREAWGGRTGGRPRGGLTTTGVGVVEVEPDRAVVRLVAEATEASVRAATAAATAGHDRLRGALLEAGVAPADLRTVATTTWTDPGDGRPGSGRPARTTVRLGVEATAPVADAGDLVARALEAAGETGRLEHTAFLVSDPSGALRRARELAFAEAVAGAEQLAALAGRPLGGVLDVREEPAAGGGGHPEAASLARAKGPVLDAGRQAVRVHVQVRHAWGDDGGGGPGDGAGDDRDDAGPGTPPGR